MAAEIKHLQFAFRNMPLESDTGWKYTSYARPNRGLHDYERVIVFAAALTEREETKLQDAIKLLDNPGYCNWSFRKLPDGRSYHVTSTMDSSD